MTLNPNVCQNVFNAKRAQIVAQSAVRAQIAATGPAKNAKTRLNVRLANKDSNWMKTSTFVFFNIPARRISVLCAAKITYVWRVIIDTISIVRCGHVSPVHQNVFNVSTVTNVPYVSLHSTRKMEFASNAFKIALAVTIQCHVQHVFLDILLTKIANAKSALNNVMNAAQNRTAFNVPRVIFSTRLSSAVCDVLSSALSVRARMSAYHVHLTTF